MTNESQLIMKTQIPIPTDMSWFFITKDCPYTGVELAYANEHNSPAVTALTIYGQTIAAFIQWGLYLRRNK